MITFPHRYIFHLNNHNLTSYQPQSTLIEKRKETVVDFD